MQISSLKIENFRCIENLEVSFGNLTALVGANNAGKSTIIKAIDLFFQAAPKITKHDHLNHDTSKKIGIHVEFCNLTPKELEEFGSAVVGGRMSVSRELSAEGTDGGEFSVHARVNPEFEAFRQETNGTKRRSIYAELRKSFDLASASGEEMAAELSRWEASNPDALSMMPVRGFFGARNVAAGKLAAKTSIRLIPAVKEAADEMRDPRKSPLLGILSDIVRQTFENKKEYVDFLASANKDLSELTDPSSVPQLGGISDQLTKTLSNYYSDTNILASLDRADSISVSFPTPIIDVEHRGLKVDVANVGHGLQRAIFFSLVQFLAERLSEIGLDESAEKENFSEAQSDIVLLIEEPEIYQHPLKQILFFNSFKSVVSGFNHESGIRIQIVYTTHSEKMVNIRDVDKLRILSRDGASGSVSCRDLTMDEFCKAISGFLGEEPMPLTRFEAGLHIFNRELSESFFAEKVILVEGVSDKAIVEAAFISKGIDIHQAGVAVVEVGGKTKLDKPLFVLRHFGIKCAVLFDNDSNAKIIKDRDSAKRRNRLIQKICARPEDEIVDFPIGWSGPVCCLDGNLEVYLADTMGGLFDEVRDQCAGMYSVSASDTLKSPVAVSSMFHIAAGKGVKFALLDELVQQFASHS